ncbi:addiction module antitoxin RelB [Bordetella genomosp. 10]|uniref:Addiction module antitoxin RelB n=1 Tax=Bordetella genomosp. 10 TaxID=1416804 RepID=A0A261RZT5_9BORD|nr:type II toxin-antitoxin system RelE/ParE family toxin [Bordetella genomosp. 10]OZI30618.1 addiction module antitoxin RelB [Bordetella genomosp. 10]
MPNLKLRETEVFASWLERLRDPLAKSHVIRRLARARMGNFGDVAPVGEGISEMRIHEGAGYRVYYTRENDVVYLLLCGGDKKSQTRDIAAAKRLWGELKGSAVK